MSFQTGLSGLNVASSSLDVIGNNIANSNTVGMKYSRTEFASLVAGSLGAGGGADGAGIGASIAAIAQQFTQGNINITGNNLDVAINGGGFFQVTLPDQSIAYTRDGQFKLAANGDLITNTKANVMGYPTDLLGNRTSITPQKMVIPTNAPIPANATTAITAEFNLDARAKIAASVTPPTPIGTSGTTLTAYDSQGIEVPVSLYFVKTGPDLTANPSVAVDTWDVFDKSTLTAGTANLATNGATYATHTANVAWNTANPGPDQKPTFGAAGTGTFSAAAQLALIPSGSLLQMTFDVNGKLLTPTTNPNLTLPSTHPAIGPFTASLDLSKATQYGTAFAVSSLTQDGYTAGDLTGITIDGAGVITTRYSNGQSQAKGQILLADFRNVQGLTQLGGGNWTESFTSGQPVLGSPGEGKFGVVRSGAVEESNVDLTGELVNMMTAQRNYQANAQTIKTQDQVMSTLVNLR
jgi:flagellar hook protein FlgE